MVSETNTIIHFLNNVYICEIHLQYLDPVVIVY